ncbi:uncharacterized protein DS421_5g156090 [Arachis hypogaea]|nr:uncharacterized protein DS421_5g156090 [Arachis hypogaea]
MQEWAHLPRSFLLAVATSCQGYVSGLRGRYRVPDRSSQVLSGNKRLPFKDELTILFKDVMADGKFAWAPSSGMLPSGIEEDGDGYQPYFEEGHIDIEEGSGDSEEDIGASVGVSSEF